MAIIDDFFKDTCVIKRSKGTTDSNGQELFDSVLSSVCTLQIGGTGETSFKATNYKFGSTVIMPYTTVLLATNDTIVITTSTGRVVSSTIENYDSFNWLKLSGTVIWLKQSENE